MNNDTAVNIIIGLIVVTVLGGLVGLMLLGDSIGCHSKYSAFDVRYGVLSGCQIQLDGKWIPADAYYIKQDIQPAK